MPTLASTRLSKPLQAQVLVAKLPVERFVGAILPRLAGVDERGFDLRRLQPAQDGAARRTPGRCRTAGTGRPVDAHELRQHLDHAARSNAAGHVDRQALAREFVDDRQALQRPPIGAGIEDEVVRPDVIRSRSAATGGAGWWRRAGAAAAGAPAAPPGARGDSVRSALIAMPLARQEDPDRPIAVARILTGERRASPRAPARPAPRAARRSPASTAPPRARRTRGGATGRASWAYATCCRRTRALTIFFG